MLKQIVAVTASKNGIGIKLPVTLILIYDKRAVSLRVGNGMTLPYIDNNAYQRVAQILRTESLDGGTVSKQDIMASLISPALVRIPGSKAAVRISYIGRYRLVYRAPHRHNIAERAEHLIRIFAEPLRSIAVAPAASVLEHLRQIPVIERHIRLYTVFEQLCHTALVIVDADRIQRAGALRQHT